MVLAFVKGYLLGKKKKQSSLSSKLQEELDIELEKKFLGRASPSFACSAGMQRYTRYDITLLFATLNITLLYTPNIMLTTTLIRYAYYNVALRYDITLLMTLFDALLIAVGV